MPTKKDIDQFIALKRANKALREFWARQVIQAGLSIIDRYGQFVEVPNISTEPKQATFNNLQIMLTTPFNQLQVLPGVGTGYMMDIWKDGKVFSLRWEPLKIDKFKRGDWLHLLFDYDANHPGFPS